MPLGQPIDRDQVLELVKAGKSNDEVAEELGVSGSAIANLKTRLRREGLLEGVPKSASSSTRSVPKSASGTPGVVLQEDFGTLEDQEDLRELLS